MDLTNLNAEPNEENIGSLRVNSENLKMENGIEDEIFVAEKEPQKEMSASEEDDSYSKIIQQVKSDQSDNQQDHLIPEDARDVSLKTDAMSQVQHLVDIAATKGIFHAVKVARHVQDNYVLDTFHDSLLADDMYKALVERGLIDPN